MSLFCKKIAALQAQGARESRALIITVFFIPKMKNGAKESTLIFQPHKS